MNSRIHIDSTAIIQATDQIRGAIDQIEELAIKIEKSLDDNAGAYKADDKDEKEIRNSIESIREILAKESQKLANNINALREFAVEMDQMY